MLNFLQKSIFIIVFAAFFGLFEAKAQVIDSIYYGWSVHEYESDDGIRQCYVTSFPTNSQTSHTLPREPYLMVTRYARKRVEEVSIYSGYEYKINSPVFVLTNYIGFKFFTDGEMAWLRSDVEDKKMIEEMLNSDFVKVRSDSSIGTYAVDEYSMKGFTRAYARMKELCK